MIADKSTTNLTFFLFFFTSRSSRCPASGKRTIARAVFRTQLTLDLVAWVFSCVTEQLCPESRAAGDPSLPGELVNLVTGRTIARNPDSCLACWTPTARTIIRFLVRTQAGQPPDTEQLFGLADKPGTHQPRKANNGWFLRVW